MIYHTLTRFESGDQGQFGRLLKWVTMEEEWLDNQRNKSSIPPGAYVCKRSWFYRGGYATFEITGVPGRSRIVFHIANTEEDVEGCVGLGLRMGTLLRTDEETNERRHKLAVLSSRAAFSEFMQHFEGIDEWVLIIEEV